MLREMQEIRKLALEYSKDDLGRMVQLGLITPQKAMLAGMMIQRVEQQNAKPPQGTVAQNLLGIQPPGAPAGAQQPQMPPQMAQGQPQMPPQGAPAPQPPMMAAEGGLMAIPAGNIGEYAGGGIVAFDDGGEVQGYAKGDLVPAGLFEALVQAESRGKQSAVSSKGARGVAQLMPGTMRDPGYGIKPVRDDSEEENRRVGREYLGAMLKKYAGNIDNALAAYNWGPGNVDKHLKKYGELVPEKLPKETRSYIPKVKTYLAQQQRPMEPRPVRVAAAPQMDEMTDGGIPAGMLMPTQDRVGVPSMLRGPLEKITRLLPSAEASGLEELPAGMQARASYAGGGIASFAGNQGSVVQETSSPVGRFFSGVPSSLNRMFAPSPEAVTAYNIQQDIDAQIRQKTEEINQLGGTFGLAQQTPEQQRLYDQKKAELRALYNLKKTGAAPPSAAPSPAAGTPKAATTGGFGAYSTPEDQFPLQSYQEMLGRRQQGVGYSDDGRIVRPGEAPPAPAPAPEAGGIAPPPLPPIERPKIDTSSFEEKVTKATPRLPEFTKTKVGTPEEILEEQNALYKKAGYDQDVFNNMIRGIEKKKGAMASEKDVALGEAIMMAGFKLMGARKGQEFQNLSEGAQEGLKNYQGAIKDLRARQEKLDDRMEQLRIADAQAKRTGAESALARRNKLEEMAQNDERAVFQAKAQAAAAGVQAATSMTVADQNLFGNMYQIETSARTQRYVAELSAQTQRDFTNMVREGQLEANKAKIIMDTATDFMTKNAGSPAYATNPAKLKEDAVAFAYDMARSTGLLPKGANIPQPRQFSTDELKQMYGLK